MALRLIGFAAALPGFRHFARAARATAENDADRPSVAGNWHHTHDRVWLGGEFWANPMEDWRVVNGAAECQSTGGDRNIHLVTHQFTDTNATFRMSVRINRLEVRRTDGGAGFRLGIRSDINEYRANCFVPRGIRAGLINGELALGPRTAPLTAAAPDGFTLTLTGAPAGDTYRLTLTATALDSTEPLGTLTASVPAWTLTGNIALVSNYDASIRKGEGARYRFSQWSVSGDAFTVTPEHRFGPILWSMYSLSDSRGDEGHVLKLTALTGPLGEQDSHDVELLVQRDGQWNSLGKASLDTDAWTATFRIPRWNEKAPAPYRLVYREQHTDGTVTESDWTGTIHENPSGRPLRIGVLTCQNAYAFPYEPVARNLLRLAPDLLFFSGDQIYENHGGYGVIREPAEPAILNYLRKFYMFGWAFREAMRDRPTLCIPDDHDVFQGNIWGEGGKAMQQGSTSSEGGYRQPPRMVNVVHTTCASHHPDGDDPTPVEQNISVYYGDMVYGGVGFAIIADRQWKSGPEHVDTGSGRADHVVDPDFDTAKLDKPGLVLLGERQEQFLEKWAGDWRAHSMKVLLSQTVFAGVATHHGDYNGYLKADLDCGGWPQTPRDRTLNIIRGSRSLHINGDQHLTTLVQYGVDRQRDSNWSFCPPAIAVGYPRWWRPDELNMPHEHRPAHGLPDTGEFIDGLGNRVYVYAVGNPEVGSESNRYDLAHQKGSGFGLVTIDTQSRTYHIESFRFRIDATDGNPANQFPGWPVTIQQKENGGDNVLS